MKKDHSDTFEGIKKENFLKDNFFLMSNPNELSTKPLFCSETAKRLNDYDSNLLKEDAYKDINDEVFKLEYKIARIENEIKLFEMQIQTAKDINDYNLLDDLISRKAILEFEYRTLLENYNAKSLSARITDKFFSILGKKQKLKFKFLKNGLQKFEEIILSIIPKQFSSLVELRKSLIKLENLNKSVDDLMSLNIPYGENYNKYEQLSKYIIKANSIQADIARNIKK